MPKFSVTLAATLLAGALGYLAYDPSAAKSAYNWLRRQVGMSTPEMKPVGAPNYTPVVPGKGPLG
jgi:hypothetical protein